MSKKKKKGVVFICYDLSLFFLSSLSLACFSKKYVEQNAFLSFTMILFLVFPIVRVSFISQCSASADGTVRRVFALSALYCSHLIFTSRIGAYREPVRTYTALYAG